MCCKEERRPVQLGCGCPEMKFRVDACRECTDVSLCDAGMTDLGRLIRLDLRVRDVCPGKRVAVAVILTEEGPCGEEKPMGMKTFTIPAHNGEICRDVRLNCIEFVAPEEKGRCGCGSLCRTRKFKARVVANYLDTDYVRCCTETEIL